MTPTTTLKENRTPPRCALCSNHQITVLKKGHTNKCPFEKEDHECLLCDNTKERRRSGKEEIKRTRKRKLEEDENLTQKPNKIRKPQKCRKCRNHNKSFASSGEHKTLCEWKNCNCYLCAGTSSLQRATRVENTHRRNNQRSISTEEVQSPDSGFGCSPDSGYDTSGSEPADSPFSENFGSPVESAQDNDAQSFVILLESTSQNIADIIGEIPVKKVTPEKINGDLIIFDEFQDDRLTLEAVVYDSFIFEEFKSFLSDYEVDMCTTSESPF